MPDWKSPFRPAAPQTSMDEYAAVRDQLGPEAPAVKSRERESS